MNQICAPGIKYEGGSCITLDVIEEMFNTYNSENKIKIIIEPNILKMKQYNPITYKKYLVDILNAKLKSKCDNQLCWLGLPIFKKMNKEEYIDLKFKTFKPEGPLKHEWLSNIDIQKIFIQYEDYYKEFKFLGAVPRDFDEIDIYKFSYLNYDEFVNSGKSKIGIIFNHDKSNSGGSHWVSMFVDLLKGKIYYFDSVGSNPKKEIRFLISKFEEYFKNKNITIEKKINNVQHQQKDSECGVYAVSFILRILDGETFDEISKNVISDDDVNLCRKKYFISI
jgi:hypothetical protein